jgi:hypothetical protein
MRRSRRTFCSISASSRSTGSVWRSETQAHVTVEAELANLVRLSVSVDAPLDRVKLEIEGVEAKDFLKVRPRHVRAILEKALDTSGLVVDHRRCATLVVTVRGAAPVSRRVPIG